VDIKAHTVMQDCSHSANKVKTYLLLLITLTHRAITLQQILTFFVCSLRSLCILHSFLGLPPIQKQSLCHLILHAL